MTLQHFARKTLAGLVLLMPLLLGVACGAIEPPGKGEKANLGLVGTLDKVEAIVNAYKKK